MSDGADSNLSIFDALGSILNRVARIDRNAGEVAMGVRSYPTTIGKSVGRVRATSHQHRVVTQSLERRRFSCGAHIVYQEPTFACLHIVVVQSLDLEVIYGRGLARRIHRQHLNR